MRTMAHRTNLHDEDKESDENEDYCNEEENHHNQCNENRKDAVCSAILI